MATIKSYTTIEQSCKLAKVLPLESADMYYREWKRMTKDIRIAHFGSAGEKDLPCWSLSALLDILPNYQLQTQDDGIGILCSYNGKFNIITAGNPIDVCYSLIIKLNEKNLL